jgi:hypothetical protein
MPEMPSSKGGKEGYTPYPHGAWRSITPSTYTKDMTTMDFWRDGGPCADGGKKVKKAEHEVAPYSESIATGECW